MLKRMRLPAVGLALVTAVAACATENVTGGQLVRSQVGDLVLEGSAGRSVLGVGDTTSVVFRLRNAGAARLDLLFSSSCRVVPFITTAPGDFVYPDGGWWGCAAVMTPLALEPGEEFVTSVVLRGGVSGPGVPLPVGQYLAYARVEHPSFPLQSEPLSILVR